MKWDEISIIDQDALLEWYNRMEVSDIDKVRLAKLFTDGEFSHWTCPACSGDSPNEILVGNPDNWDHFQGVCDSSGGLGELCNECTSLYVTLKEHAGE